MHPPFIGDLSIEDADVLAHYAHSSDRVLEFGAGGSTQIFAQLCREVVTVETAPVWVERTRKRLEDMGLRDRVEFRAYPGIPVDAKLGDGKQYPLIFVDGVDHLRREFAITAWPLLEVDGVMIFHDTRRFADFQNAAWVAQLFHNEIASILVNQRNGNGRSSNCTVIRKKQHEPYVNWNLTEGKPLEAYGNGG
jgi:hypothetical protein